MGLGVVQECIRQYLPVLQCESERREELRLSSTFWMIESEEVIRNLASLNPCIVCIWQPH